MMTFAHNSHEDVCIKKIGLSLLLYVHECASLVQAALWSRSAQTELLCLQAFREEVQISLQGCQAQCSYVLGTCLSMFGS